MKQIVTITGIRPDFIRMSEVFRKLDKAEWCEHILIHSGQHYDTLLSSVFFEDLEIRNPDYNLAIGGAGKKHYHQQAELGIKIIELFKKENIDPDVVLFLGDSNSVLSAVPLKKEGYKIGHIEAGMRSYDDRMLEEVNRKVCDHLSSFLFVYHNNYKEKALLEGIDPNKIFVVGNTVVEPLRKIAKNDIDIAKTHILLDIHRPENFQYPERMKGILDFANYSIEETGLPVKMLKFTRTIDAIEKFGLETGRIEMVDLMGYKDFVQFMSSSKFMISDSGTAQEEPALLKIPVLVPREFSERPESYEANCSKKLDLDKNLYDSSLKWALSEFHGSSEWLGDGNTSSMIVEILRNHL